MFACSSEVESRLPTARLLIPVAFQPVKKAPYVIFPMSHPRLGVSNMWFKLLTPQGRYLPMYSFSSEYSPLDTGPNMIVFSSYPISCGPFLQIWLYVSLAASLQSVFSEDCSTLRCMSEVFVGYVSSTYFFAIYIDIPLLFVVHSPNHVQLFATLWTAT